MKKSRKVSILNGYISLYYGGIGPWFKFGPYVRKLDFATRAGMHFGWFEVWMVVYKGIRNWRRK